MKWDTFENRLRITGELVAVTSVRVGMSAESAMPTATDLPVIKDASGRPFIPGSSLRGAVRAHIERIVRAFEPDPRDGKGAHDPIDVKAYNKLYEEKSDEEIFTVSSRVDRVFGSPKLASRVRFTDLPLLTEGAEPELRDSVAIDREKESVANKYDFEAMPAGVRFKLEIVAENLDDHELGLLLLGVRELERGNIRIGGFKGRGLGVVTLENVRYEWVDRNSLLAYLVDNTTQPVDQAWVNAKLQALFDSMANQGG
jgi:CRISPR-associated RAMP protein (TIGR02581 family)